MADFNVEMAKKERTKLMVDMGKIRKKIKAYDDFIEAIEASEAATSGRNQDSNKARAKALIPECIQQNGGKATKEEISAYLAQNGVKVTEGTLNVYMSKDENIRYHQEDKAWFLVE